MTFTITKMIKSPSFVYLGHPPLFDLVSNYDYVFVVIGEIGHKKITELEIKEYLNNLGIYSIKVVEGTMGYFSCFSLTNKDELILFKLMSKI